MFPSLKNKSKNISLKFGPKLVKTNVKNAFDIISYWNSSAQKSVLICVVPQK